MEAVHWMKLQVKHSLLKNPKIMTATYQDPGLFIMGAIIKRYHHEDRSVTSLLEERLHDCQIICRPLEDKQKALKFVESTETADGFGVNLTAADTCIFYDNDWSPQMDPRQWTSITGSVKLSMFMFIGRLLRIQ